MYLKFVFVFGTLLWCMNVSATTHPTNLASNKEPCLIPSIHIKPEWFTFNNHEAHARVRDGSMIWTFNLFTEQLILNQDIIKKTINYNSSQHYATAQLGCLSCLYSSPYSKTKFWACGSTT